MLGITNLVQLDHEFFCSVKRREKYISHAGLMIHSLIRTVYEMYVTYMIDQCIYLFCLNKCYNPYVPV